MNVPLHVLNKVLDHDGYFLHVARIAVHLLVQEELLEVFKRYQLVVPGIGKATIEDIVDGIRRHHQFLVESSETVETNLVALLHVHFRKDLHQRQLREENRRVNGHDHWETVSTIPYRTNLAVQLGEK